MPAACRPSPRSERRSRSGRRRPMPSQSDLGGLPRRAVRVVEHEMVATAPLDAAGRLDASRGRRSRPCSGSERPASPCRQAVAEQRPRWPLGRSRSTLEASPTRKCARSRPRLRRRMLTALGLSSRRDLGDAPRRLPPCSGRGAGSGRWGRPTSPLSLALAARDPVVNVFADYRARPTRLEPRWLGGEMWGRVRRTATSSPPATPAPTWCRSRPTPTTPEAFAGAR